MAIKKPTFKKPITPTLIKMRIGSKSYFLIEKMNSVRTTATNLKRTKGFEYIVSQLNEKGLIKVIRVL